MVHFTQKPDHLNQNLIDNIVWSKLRSNLSSKSDSAINPSPISASNFELAIWIWFWEAKSPNHINYPLLPQFEVATHETSILNFKNFPHFKDHVMLLWGQFYTVATLVNKFTCVIKWRYNFILYKMLLLYP